MLWTPWRTIRVLEEDVARSGPTLMCVVENSGRRWGDRHLADLPGRRFSPIHSPYEDNDGFESVFVGTG